MKKKNCCPNIWMNDGKGDQILLGDFLRFNGILGNDPTKTEDLDNMIERLTVFKEYGEYLKNEKNSFGILTIGHTRMCLSVIVPSKVSEFQTGEVPNIGYRDVDFVSVGDECHKTDCVEKRNTDEHPTSGKITDRVAAEIAIGDYCREVKEKLGKTPVSKLLVIVPADFTAEDLDVLRGAVQKSGAKDIRFIYRPLAEALCMGCDIYKPYAKMIVHFGKDVTEISVIALGGIVVSRTVPVSVNTFAEDMCDYIRGKFNVQIDVETARNRLLTNHWSFPTGKSRNRKVKYSVEGIAESFELSYVDVSKALGKSLNKIEETVTEVLDVLPPELLGDLAIGKVVSWLRRKEKEASSLKETADSWVFFGLDEDIYFKKDEQITVTGEWPFAPALKERVGETLARYFQKILPKEKDMIKELKRNLSKIVVDETEGLRSPSQAFDMPLMLFDRFDDILIK